MATARELLEHADALMRRNRAPDGAPVADIPPAGQRAPVAVVPPPPAARDATPAEDDDVPVLTDVVEDFEPISIMGMPDDPVAAAEWPDFDDDEAVVIERARPSAVRAAPIVDDRAAPADDRAAGDASVPEAAAERAASALDATAESAASALDAEGDAPAAPRAESARPVEPAADVPGSAAPAPPLADEARWNALAEEVRMQVLQRIDIFTDTGLQEQLAARLQPIVDRASADLVAAINHHVGQLMRSYVAEAIEREIDKWRQGGGG